MSYRVAPLRTRRLMRGFQGLGVLNYYDLLRMANLQDCAPMDSTCVSNNVAKQAAVEDLWATKYQATGAPDDLVLNFTPQTAAQVREFYNPENMVSGGNVVDTRGIMSASITSQPEGIRPPVAPVSACGDPPQIRLNWMGLPNAPGSTPFPNPDDVNALAAWSKCTGIKSSLPPLPTGPPPSATPPIQASAKLQPALKVASPAPPALSDFIASFTPGTSDSGGFSFSSLPWWVWAGGAGALLFAFGGKK